MAKILKLLKRALKQIVVYVLLQFYAFLYKITNDKYEKKYLHYAEKFECTKDKKCICYKEFLKYIKKRENLSINEVEKLSAPFNFFNVISDEICGVNDYYGIARIYKKYAGYPLDYKLKFVIDHAVYIWSDYFNTWEYQKEGLAHIVTSEYAKSCIEPKTNCTLYPAGLHIYYADDYYSEAIFKAEKEKLGKNLLVFPFHSSDCLLHEWKPDKLINEILKIQAKGKFNSVTICFYFCEIQRGFHKNFKGYGFNFVTAGHILDPMFLSRLKTIIKLSDVTMSNAIGSPIAYSIGLNKPHYLVNEKDITSYCTPILDQNSQIAQESVKEFKNSLKDKTTQEYEKAFSTYTEVLTEEQLKIKDKICGEKSIRSPLEIRKFFEETEKLYNTQGQSETQDRYVHTFAMVNFLKNYKIIKNKQKVH